MSGRFKCTILHVELTREACAKRHRASASRGLSLTGTHAPDILDDLRCGPCGKCSIGRANAAELLSAPHVRAQRRNCRSCGKSFDRMTRNQMYCSVTCRGDVHREAVRRYAENRRERRRAQSQNPSGND